MTENSPSSVPEVVPPRSESTSEVRPVSKAWVIVGTLVALIGAVMGFIMSSLGK